MCGIAGCAGAKNGIKNVMNILHKLEYRGYDSSGIAYVVDDELNVIKSLGNLQNLKNEVVQDCAVNSVIGHTRWATHGKPTIANAHPQIDMAGSIALVHNGIIENYQVLKQELLARNVRFISQTDTEVVAQMLGLALSNIVVCEEKELIKKVLKAITQTVAKIKGSYAFAFIYKSLGDHIFFAKNGSPLVVGKGASTVYLASDENAIKGSAKGLYRLKDYEIGYTTADSINIFDRKMNKKSVALAVASSEEENFDMRGYSSFLNKEIAEGVSSALKTARRTQKELKKLLPEYIFESDFNLHITACGTALHAGRIARYLIERELRIPVSLDFASEFKYKKPILNEKSICIFISQSGETADTLGCVAVAKECGATTIGITNVKNSRLDDAVDYCIYTYAGVEISVASTKAFMAQLAAIYALVIYLAELKQVEIGFGMPDVVHILLKLKDKNYLFNLVKYLDLIKKQSSIYFVGRGLDYFVALEGALKLKEICYIHCEAFAGGELKHGSLALINNESVVVAVLTQRNLIDKMLNNIHEMNSRGAKVILFSPFSKLRDEVYGFVKIPRCKDAVCPFGAVKPLQELTLYIAEGKGLDPDKPRNLAKSVTVE